MEERSEVMHQYEKINGLYQLLSGNRKNSRMDIETYVQRHYLEQILEAANQRFQDMSAGQFELRMCDIDKAGTGEKLIGIISHVTELKQEIEDQLIVTKDDQGSHTRWQIS